MLNDKDIEFIKANRSEITQNREEPITLFRKTQTGTDPFTEDPIYNEVEETVYGTCNDIISMSSGGEDIGYLDGMQFVVGDAIMQLDISIDFEGVDHVRRRGDLYEVMSHDIIGLGEDNRHQVLIRRQS